MFDMTCIMLLVGLILSTFGPHIPYRIYTWCPPPRDLSAFHSLKLRDSIACLSIIGISISLPLLSFLPRLGFPIEKPAFSLTRGNYYHSPAKKFCHVSRVCLACLDCADDVTIECRWHHIIIDLLPLQRVLLLVGMVTLGICQPRHIVRLTLHQSQ